MIKELFNKFFKKDKDNTVPILLPTKTLYSTGGLVGISGFSGVSGGSAFKNIGGKIGNFKYVDGKWIKEKPTKEYQKTLNGKFYYETRNNGK